MWFRSSVCLSVNPSASEELSRTAHRAFVRSREKRQRVRTGACEVRGEPTAWGRIIRFTRSVADDGAVSCCFVCECSPISPSAILLKTSAANRC